jgi:hypothetical protein
VDDFVRANVFGAFTNAEQVRPIVCVCVCVCVRREGVSLYVESVCVRRKFTHMYTHTIHTQLCIHIHMYIYTPVFECAEELGCVDVHLQFQKSTVGLGKEVAEHIDLRCVRECVSVCR